MTDLNNIKASPLYLQEAPNPIQIRFIKNDSSYWGFVVFMIFIFITFVCVLVYVFFIIRDKKWFRDIVDTDTDTNTSHKTPQSKNNTSKNPN